MKKFLKITGITVLVIIAILFAAPFLFKGKIITLVKAEINKSVNAKVDFADVDISLLRRFPRLAVAVEKLQVVGNGAFAKDTLISAENIDVALNLMSVIRGDKMTIYSVDVNKPRIHALVAKDSSVNWDIMKPDTTAATDTAASEPFNLELKSYAIHDGYIAYRDSVGNMSSEIIGLEHEGSGDFTADIFTLKTKTAADAVNFTYGPVPYLVNAKTSIDADIQVDNRTSKYSFKTDEVKVNELKIATAGFFQLVNDSTYNMDITFNAPSTDFKNILSLIPVVYQKDFAKVKTSGKAIFNGAVKGVMSNTSMPAYNINLDVANGFFQYPDLPAPVKNINVELKVNNPDGVTDHTVVNIPKAHFEMENDPFDLRLLVRTPISNLWVDAAAKGKVDLSKITRMVKLDEGTSIKGLLNADLALKGFVEAVQKQQFNQFTANGTLALNGFSYVAKDYPDGVALDRLLMTFNPQNVTLNEASGKYLNTNFAANGSVNNLIAYTLKNEPLDGVVNVKADRVDVNAFMGTSDSSATDSTSGPFVVPANLDLVLNAQAGEVKYDNLLMQNVSGSLLLKDETVKLDNVRGNALDGTIAISGSYSTRENKKKPAIALQYDVEELDIQKTFTTFNTVQKLMPVAKFLSGKMTSRLTMTGNLGGNMFPDLTTLTGNGNILLIEGVLKKFKPLEQLASRLNVEELQDITLREVREQFEFNAGKVLVKPFQVKLKDITMEIGGVHGLDQSLDYTIAMKVPRSMIGAKGNQLLNNLITQANSRGVPVKVDEVVDINVRMLGTITNPDLQFNLKQAAGSLTENLKEQAKEFAQAKIDSTKKAVSDTLQSLKKAVVKDASDRLKAQLFGNSDTLRSSADSSASKPANPADRLKESGKGLIENINPFKKKKG